MPATCTGAEPGSGSVPTCRHVNQAVGVRVALHPRHCEICRRQGGTGQTAMCRALVRQCLAARLVAGDLPRYDTRAVEAGQPAERVDLAALFGRFAALAPVEEQRALIQRMFRNQARFSEAEGGLPAQTLAAAFAALAERFHLTDALEEVVYAHRT